MNRTVLVAATAMATTLVTVPATAVHAAPAAVTLVPYVAGQTSAPIDITWHPTEQNLRLYYGRN